VATWEPRAATALLEGLEECFTHNRLDVPRSLHRCLATGNIVDSPHSRAQPDPAGLPLAFRHAGPLVRHPAGGDVE